jgi:hypothetical protein
MKYAKTFNKSISAAMCINCTTPKEKQFCPHCERHLGFDLICHNKECAVNLPRNFPSRCHYGCYFGGRCLGSSRDEVIEYLSSFELPEILASKSDGELEEILGDNADGVANVPDHIRRKNG